MSLMCVLHNALFFFFFCVSCVRCHRATTYAVLFWSVLFPTPHSVPTSLSLVHALTPRLYIPCLFCSLSGLEYECILHEKLRSLCVPFTTESLLRVSGADCTPDVKLQMPIGKSHSFSPGVFAAHYWQISSQETASFWCCFCCVTHWLVGVPGAIVRRGKCTHGERIAREQTCG